MCKQFVKALIANLIVIEVFRIWSKLILTITPSPIELIHHLSDDALDLSFNRISTVLVWTAASVDNTITEVAFIFFMYT